MDDDGSKSLKFDEFFHGLLGPVSACVVVSEVVMVVDQV
jgi:hypothetical protein